MRCRKHLLPFALALLTLAQAQTPSLPASAMTVPRMVRYGGMVKLDKDASRTVGMTFSLYKDQDSAAPLWVELQNVTIDALGRYFVQLGSTLPLGLPADLFSSGEARWLGVQVSGQLQQPRVLLLSVPYALKAADAETLGGLPLSAFVLAASANGGSGSTNATATTAATATIAPPLVRGTGAAWRVTGIRQDASANADRIRVEEAKPESQRGFYLHPELYGASKD